MKAQVWRGRKRVVYEDVPDPFPARDGWVVIKVKWAGICASDFNEYLSGPVFVPTTTHPLSGKCGSLTQGHEFSGEVVEIGKGVTRVKVGDRVTSDVIVKCGECYWCSIGEYIVCDKVAYLGEMDDGGFAEYVAAPEYSLYKLPDELSYELGATAEPVAVTVHGIMISKLRIGETVGVVGCGPIGLMALQVARNAGAVKVFAFEPIDSRRNLASELGADFALNPYDKKTEEIVKKNTGGIGPDVVLECVGTEEAANYAINLVRTRGRVVIIGIAHQDYVTNFNNLVFAEREIYGSSGTWKGFPAALKYLAEGKVNTAKLITGKILLKDLVEKGYEERIRNPQENLKILMTPDPKLL
jgi:(R,R)-butanediol dehydrogenase / meso-butanediol dehydrogenase / diacetyl reductase